MTGAARDAEGTGREHALVAHQFGPRARAYVESADHATGADLARIAELASTRRCRRALDVGAGGGHVSYAVARHAEEVVACDLTAAMCHVVRAEAQRRELGNIRCVRASADALPFASGSFDLVATRYSAHHWPDLQAGVLEMRRVLAPGGTAVFVDTIAPAAPRLADSFLQAIELVRDPSHVRNATEAEWLEAARQAGLIVTAVAAMPLRLAFDQWIARMATPPDQTATIRALQRRMPREIRDLFSIEDDGTMTIPTLLVEAKASGAER